MRNFSVLLYTLQTAQKIEFFEDEIHIYHVVDITEVSYSIVMHVKNRLVSYW